MDHAFAVFIRMGHDATDTERRIVLTSSMQCTILAKKQDWKKRHFSASGVKGTSDVEISRRCFASNASEIH